MRRNIELTQTQLEELVGKYFEAQTTETEEEQLREYLAFGQYDITPEIESILAIFSLRNYERHKQKKSQRNRFWIEAASIAASIAVIISIAVHYLSDSGDICQTYVAGIKYSDQSIVLRNIENDFALMDEITSSSADIVAEELSEFIGNINLQVAE